MILKAPTSITHMLRMEEWRPVEIQGFSKYEASSHGRIRNVKTGGVLKTHVTNAGYRRLGLTRDDKSESKQFVHRIVASAFLPDWCAAHSVDHIDRNKQNNEIVNLRMATASEQQFNRIISKQDRSVLKVAQYDKEGTLLKVHESIAEAACCIGANECSIYNAAMGKRQHCYGFRWKYLTESGRRPEEDRKVHTEQWRQVQDSNVWISNECQAARVTVHGRREVWQYDQLCKSNGYGVISVNGRQVMFHRLVAALFLDRPTDPQKCIVNHKDGNKDNPMPDNLEWCTFAENARHAHDMGLIASRKRVRQETLCGAFVAVHPSITMAARHLGVSRESVRDCVNKRQKTCAGYRFMSCNE